MKKKLHLIIVVGGLMLLPTGIAARCKSINGDLHCGLKQECSDKGYASTSATLHGHRCEDPNL